MSGCVQPKAQVLVDPPPPLDVPLPPPRIIVPPDPTPPPVAEEPEQPVEPPRPRPTRPSPQRAESKPADSAKSIETAEAVKPAGTPEPVPLPGPTLELQPVDGAGAANIRQQLKSASDDLGRVNYVGLSRDLQIQYDTARRFITLADQALKEQNLIFAATLADKAGAIATLLLRR